MSNPFRDILYGNIEDPTLRLERLEGILLGLTQQAATTDMPSGEINVKSPPIPMVGLKGNGVEEGEAIKTLLNSISTNYTKATVRFPYGTYKSNQGIVLPNNVNVLGQNLSKLDFSGAPSDVVAVKRSGSRARFEDFEIVGNGFNDGIKVGKSSIGLDVYGDHHVFKNLLIKDFETLIDIAHTATYLNGFEDIFLANSTYCLYADLASRGATNAGERITFKRTTFCNSKLCVRADLSALDIYFESCSFDYSSELLNVGNGIYSFTNCHFENTINNPNRGSQSLNDWFVTTTSGASLLFTNCLFDLYGMKTIINPNSTLGTAIFKNCRAYFLAGDGTNKNLHSEHPVYVDINKSSVSVYSPYVSKITYATVLGATNTDKKQIPLDITVATDLVNYKYDVTFASPTAERTWIKVMY